ncbi:unnamed protein product [Phytomonas sp. EM1]|nr:unnamed protein product [Phytomonas sp. EM1]|eukprot:CCW61142.1 unnamed protein product [Phytomonas sp. isolate EM1]
MSEIWHLKFLSRQVGISVVVRCLWIVLRDECVDGGKRIDILFKAEDPACVMGYTFFRLIKSTVNNDVHLQASLVATLIDRLKERPKTCEIRFVDGAVEFNVST